MRNIIIGFLVVMNLFLIYNHFQPQPVMAEIFGEDSNYIIKPGIKKFEYTASVLDYMGYNGNPDAATSDTDWIVFEYTFSGSDLVEIERRTGAYDDRSTMFN